MEQIHPAKEHNERLIMEMKTRKNRWSEAKGEKYQEVNERSGNTKKEKKNKNKTLVYEFNLWKKAEGGFMKRVLEKRIKVEFCRQR